jgi:hypothetical protein
MFAPWRMPTVVAMRTPSTSGQFEQTVPIALAWMAALKDPFPAEMEAS